MRQKQLVQLYLRWKIKTLGKNLMFGQIFVDIAEKIFYI